MESNTIANVDVLNSSTLEVNKKTKRVKKKRRKKSDPLVSNISALMSTSLSLISPEKRLSLAVGISNEISGKLERSDGAVAEVVSDLDNKDDAFVTKPRKKRSKSRSPLKALPQGGTEGKKRRSKDKLRLSLNVLKSPELKSKKELNQGNLNMFIQIKTPNGNICESNSLETKEVICTSEAICVEEYSEADSAKKKVRFSGKIEQYSPEPLSKQVAEHKIVVSVSSKKKLLTDDVANIQNTVKADEIQASNEQGGKKLNPILCEIENTSELEEKNKSIKETENNRTSEITKIDLLRSNKGDKKDKRKSNVIETRKENSKVNKKINVQDEDRGKGKSTISIEEDIQILKDGPTFEEREGKTEKNNIEILQVTDESSDLEIKVIEPKNAFQFMMDSRNKSIGRNSPGKDLETINTDDEVKTEKSKLSARKSLLNEWAIAKGGLKRKIEYEERQLYIDHRLEQRSKRLKKLLQVKNEVRVTPRRYRKLKRVNKIDTDTESSKDSFDASVPVVEGKKLIGRENIKSSKLPESIDVSDNTQDNVWPTKQPKPNRNSVQQKQLMNFFGVINTKDTSCDGGKANTDEDIDVIDITSSEQNNVIKIKMFSPRVFKSKKRLSLKQSNHEERVDVKCKEEEKYCENKLETKKHFKDQSSGNNIEFFGHKRSKKKSNKECKEKGLVKNTLFDKSESSKMENSELKSDKNTIEILDESGTDKIKKNRKTNVLKTDSEASDFEHSNTGTNQNKRHTKDIELNSHRNHTTETFAYKIKRKGKSNVLKADTETSDVERSDKGSNQNKRHTKTIELNNRENHTAEMSDKCLTNRVKRKRKTNVLKTESEASDLEHTDKESNKGVEEGELYIRKSLRQKVKKVDHLFYTDDEDSNDSVKTKHNKGRKNSQKEIKIAPVFLKSTPKPKVDPSVIEARKSFLLSGVPDSLKKVMEKQQSVQEIEYDVFPSISHIQQKVTSATSAQESDQTNSIDFWNLPSVNIKLLNFETYLPVLEELKSGTLTKCNSAEYHQISLYPPEKIANLKTILQEIKGNNPDYPVYKSFRLLKEKAGKENKAIKKVETVQKDICPPVKRKRGRPKKTQQLNDRVEVVAAEEPPIVDNDAENFAVWTEKYKARTTEDIIGNYKSTAEVKNWLQSWLDYSHESKLKRRKIKRHDSSSSEFDDTDGESRDSVRLPGNTVIVTGPHGCGKTMAIYAICNELGVNVLELDASSKRTGKRLLQELQEATQSHQVHKNESNNLGSFLQGSKSNIAQKSQQESEENSGEKKMCLLLIKDVDIVFEQDEGFLSALTQLLLTSKRPVILVTSDINCLHLQKFIMQYPIVTFAPLTGSTLSIWLQILCLVEGLKVDRSSLSELLEWNTGDVRRTLLQLQFWVQSGGGCTVQNLEEKSSRVSAVQFAKNLDEFPGDDNSNLPFFNDSIQDSAQSVATHTNCVSSFLDSDMHVPYPLDLGLVWWNLPNVLNISNFTRTPKKGFQVRENTKETSSHLNLSEESKHIGGDLASLASVFDNFSLTDVAYTKVDLECNNEPCSSSWKPVVKHSLELCESMDVYNDNKDLTNSWASYLLGSQINPCKNSERKFNMAVPGSDERRWRSKQHECGKKFLELLPTSCQTDRRAFTLDYFPSLRTISRAEMVRSTVNNKRGNRFYNYLRSLGFNYSESVNKTACNIFNIESTNVGDS